MSDQSQEARAVRRRWINLGEFVAVAGLIISGLALWNSWSDGKPDNRETVAVEKTRAIPIALRGRIGDEGKVVILSPVEAGHALDSATITANGNSVDIGSDGRLSAEDAQALFREPAKGEPTTGAQVVSIKVRFVEGGADKVGGGNYRLSYRWEGGGLFSGRSVRLTDFRRA